MINTRMIFSDKCDSVISPLNNFINFNGSYHYWDCCMKRIYIHYVSKLISKCWNILKLKTFFSHVQTIFFTVNSIPWKNVLYWIFLRSTLVLFLWFSLKFYFRKLNKKYNNKIIIMPQHKRRNNLQLWTYIKIHKHNTCINLWKSLDK